MPVLGMAAAGNSKKEELKQELQASMLFPALFSTASHNGMGQHQKDKLLLSPLFSFCFPRGFGGPLQQTKQVFPMLVT